MGRRGVPPPKRGAHAALELPAGEIPAAPRIALGDRLAWGSLEPAH